MKHNGLFISFEGPEGSGKSTIIKLLSEQLNYLILKNELNFSSVLLTREPGGKNNLIAEEIRHLILNVNNIEIPYITEAFLFAASRSAHVEKTIKPILDNNGIVLSDRYLDSSVVYQGVQRGLGIEKVLEINKYAINGLIPDITFYFDIDPQIGLNRILINNRDTNRFDNIDIKEHIKIANAYKEYLSKLDRVCIVDASQSIENVYNFCLTKILEFIRG